MESLKPGTSFKAMYNLQLNLIKYYKEIEGWPEFPLDLVPKKNQALIKDFGNRLKDELSEAYEELTLGFSAASQNKPQEAKNHIRLFNLELGDAWHFFMELLIAIGWDEERIFHELRNHLDEGSENLIKDGDLITSLIRIAGLQNQIDNTQFKPGDIGAYRIISPEEFLTHAEFRGSRNLSYAGLMQQESFLWNITHSFSKTLNLLKNKPWSLEEKKVNEMEFNNGMINAIVMFMRYMDYIDKSETSIYNSYVLVNQKNLDRLKNKY